MRMSRSSDHPLDRANDSRISAATADVAVHPFDNLSASCRGICIQKRGRLHNLARLAVSALRYPLCDPRLLKWVIGVGGKALDGGYASVRDIFEKRLTGSDSVTIEMDRARAAEGDTAAEFCAG